eukprot:1061010-Amphidinium_carterae.2
MSKSADHAGLLRSTVQSTPLVDCACHDLLFNPCGRILATLLKQERKQVKDTRLSGRRACGTVLGVSESSSNLYINGPCLRDPLCCPCSFLPHNSYRSGSNVHVFVILMQFKFLTRYRAAELRNAVQRCFIETDHSIVASSTAWESIESPSLTNSIVSST